MPERRRASGGYSDYREGLASGAVFSVLWVIVCSSSIWVLGLVGGAGSQIALEEPAKSWAGVTVVGAAVGLYCGAILGVAQVMQLSQASWRLQSWIARNILGWIAGVSICLSLFFGAVDIGWSAGQGTLFPYLAIGGLIGSTTSLAQWSVVRSHGPMHWFLLAGIAAATVAGLVGAGVQFSIGALAAQANPGDDTALGVLLGFACQVMVWGFLDGVRLAYWQRRLEAPDRAT